MTGEFPTDTPASGRRKGRRVTRSLNRARTVQLRMLPPAPSLEQVEIDVFYEACEELGGDFYDFIQLTPTTLGIVLADVSGHGVDAALMMSAAKKTLQILARTIPSPADVLKAACAELANEIPAGSFVTAWYGVLGLDTGKLTFASAGHNPLILSRPGRQPAAEQVTAKGVVLGAAFVNMIGTALEEKTIQLERGDMLLLYTDGASEALSPAEDEYGIERLVQGVAQGPQTGAKPLLAHLRRQIDDFCAGRKLDDDITLLALRFAGAPEPEPAWRPRIDTNLLPRTTPFIGREREMSAIRAAIEGGVRVIEVIGVAGLGKTRLALEAGRAHVNEFAGGTWMVQLASCKTADEFHAAVADALRLQVSGNEPAEQRLGRMLGLRGKTLAVLDNCEGVLEPVRAALGRWRVLAPDFHCVATSQVRLATRGATELVLRPLGLPPTDAHGTEVGTADAVRLFMDRAMRANPEFALTDENANDVAAICRELEGMPLAIELTASRMNVLTPGQALGQMQHPSSRIALLRAKTQGLSAQYGSLREALEWSFDQLSPWELAVFRELCAFEGGFFYEQAEAVVQEPDDGKRLSDALQGLIDKSFLWREGTPYGTRFTTLGALRTFARYLAKDTEQREAALHHAECFRGYAAEWVPLLNGVHMFEATERLVLERANFRAALATAMSEQHADAAAELGGAVAQLAMRSGGMDEAVKLLVPVLALLHGEPEREVRLLNTMGFMQQRLGTLAAARETFLQAEKLASGLPAGPLKLLPEFNRNLLDGVLRLDAAAQKRIVDYVAQFREKGDTDNALRGHMALAAIYIGQRKLDLALEQAGHAEEISRNMNSLFKLSGARAIRADALIAKGELDEAWRILEQLAPVTQRLGMPDAQLQTAMQRAEILEQSGRYDDALEILHTAWRGARRTGSVRHAIAVQSAMADVYLAVEDFESAAEAANSALEMALPLGVETLITPALLRLGEARLALGEFAVAEDHLLQAVARAQQNQSWPHFMAAKALMAMVELGEGDAEAAEKTAHAGLEVAVQQALESGHDYILLLAVRARALHGLKRGKEAHTVAAQARKQAEAAGHGKHSANRVVHRALTLLDVPSGADKRETVHAKCSRCGQKYSGSAARIKKLVKCLNCGTAPFTPA